MRWFSGNLSVPDGCWAAFAVGVALIALAPASLSAQFAKDPFALTIDDGFVEHDFFIAPPLYNERRYVLVHVEANRLYLIEDGRPVWSAPVATGHGFRLEANGRAWKFDTPRGIFRVQHKEKDPVWIKPDWAYLREGLPVPPLNSPSRRQRGMLGSTAVYIGFELALHGTDSPELVLAPDPDKRRVSHGCIRLTNEDARALFHRVEIGTPVLIY